jgi:hypothetical protein
MSCAVLERAVERNGLEYERDEVRFMQALIRGGPRPVGEPERAWLLDILHNTRNGVDVDKFDYIARDAHMMLGARAGAADVGMRLIMHARVLQGEVCFHAKQAYELYELFHQRYSLFKQVYSHRVGKAVEYMLCDVLALADPVLGLSERLGSVDGFLTLTDSVVHEIEWSRDAGLDEARRLIRDIRCRRLYKMAVEALVDDPSRQPVPELDEATIARCSDGALSEQDVIVQHLRLNYSMRGTNPVDNVHFWGSDRECATRVVEIDRRAVSLLIPEVFEEHYLRVFCRDPANVARAQEAFSRWQAATTTTTRFVDPPHTPTKLTASMASSTTK